MTFGSLFAGIGGMDLGLERAGMECKWQVEIDDFCRKVLTKHWPEVPKYGDIKELTGDELATVDLIAGGFPCQPISVAGKRRGREDERWLWPEFARIIRVVRPRLVLVENVPGLLSRGMREVLGQLAKLGYDAQWHSIPACAFGARHIRERLYMLATTGKVDYTDCFDSRSFLRQARTYRRWTENTPIGSCFDGGTWSREPRLARVAYGISTRVERLSALGNAVVPQVAEWIGRQIMSVRTEAQP